MEILSDGSRRHSPKDLIAYLEGDFAAWCERFTAQRKWLPAGLVQTAGTFEPDEDPEMALLARFGREHEARYLNSLRQQGAQVVEIPRGKDAAELTLAAMREGADIIYQACLEEDFWFGYPDFLQRTNGKSRLGPWRYEPWDTKLARSVRPYFIIQLCAYADYLKTIQGVRPEQIGFILGDGTATQFPTDQFFYYYRQLTRSFLAFQEAWRADRMPDPALDRSWGRWATAAEARLAARDHLIHVANITRGQIARFEDAGIATVRALAELGDRPVSRVSGAVRQRLSCQARLQLASLTTARPQWELRPPEEREPRRGLALLPPASAGDVFFDMEGYPFAEGGLEYLFGAVVIEGDKPRFQDWWAHDHKEEKVAFEQFIDWVHARWRADPTMHIYHYAGYEPTAVKRLMGAHATRESKVDDLLRAGTFVDLYTIVRQGVVVGTPSYSLKDIERLYRGPRQTAVTTAGGSVLEYQRWIDEAEPRDWQQSPILGNLRAYNAVDCESLKDLRDWLLARQAEAGIDYLPPVGKATAVTPDVGPSDAERLAARLLERADQLEPPDGDAARVTRLVAWLVEYHRREEKPMWWRMFERHQMTEEELAEDFDCLAGLVRTERPPRAIKRSFGLEYRFDPDQETRMRADSKCYVAGDLDLKTEIVAMDPDTGLLELKVGPGKNLPDRLSLIPNEHVSADTIKSAIYRYADAWAEGRIASQAADDLLFRRPPRVRGHPGGALLDPCGELLPQVVDLIPRLDGTTLGIQGPPGTGKTYTAAAVIADLLRRGATVGVAANSHKVIFNLLRAIASACVRAGIQPPLYKAGEAEDELVDDGRVQAVDSDEVADLLGHGACVVGGTAWVFTRQELEGRLDYLFIDEAGQVPLANAVAMGLSARNLILIGDQMQLGQPTQGSHPGESGSSCIEYLLQGHPTVPPDRGVFLAVSRRMHPAVCQFISHAIYEARLTSLPATAQHRVCGNGRGDIIHSETGVVFVPSAHAGCEQSSEEEVELIERIVAELMNRSVVDANGGPRPLRVEDILIVAPFNMQVRSLAARLGRGARVGSVDKFQGQEAPVVIVSLCSSSLEEAPRGAAFLLSPNRLNVAVSRAQALAVVVGCPALLATRCRSLKDMRLVNLLCRLEQYVYVDDPPPGSPGAGVAARSW